MSKLIRFFGLLMDAIDAILKKVKTVEVENAIDKNQKERTKESLEDIGRIVDK